MVEAPSLFIALLAGIVSFLSPCVLPLVPAYIGYMSGSTLAAAGGGSVGMSNVGAMAVPTGSTVSAFRAAPPIAQRWVVMVHALLFVLGLTVVLVVVIGGLAGTFSYLLKEKKLILQQVMGLLLVIFGLHTIGAINVPFLNYTRRLDMRPAENLGYLRSFLIGAAFGIGWTPCVGPTLGAIFTLALNGEEGQAFLPALAYSLGLGIPFLLTALAMGRVSSGLKRLTRRSYSLRVGNRTLIREVNVVSLVSGLLLMIMGLLVFTNSLTILTTIAPNFGL
ncbi:MAG: cytochrome c biogenesis CcdA family protein [Chloroflexia bacterium]